MLEEYKDNLDLFPASAKTPVLCEVAVLEFGAPLSWVPLNYRNQKICNAVVKRDFYALRDVPTNLLTRELCLKAVSFDSNNIDYVP